MAPKSKQQFEEIREEKRELIKTTALKLFAEKGYHLVSIREISKAANISQGLMYNYFESKESLLQNILTDFIEIVGSLISPKGDEEITNEEMENFFELMIESIKNRREYWIVLFQLAMQKDVLSLVFSQKGVGDSAGKFIQLSYKFFADRFENPLEELLLFRSVVKGFALILVLTPDMCPDELVDSFKERLKKMFIKPKTINS